MSKLAVAKRINCKTIFYLYTKQSQLKLPLVHSKSTTNSCNTVPKFNQKPQSKNLQSRELRPTVQSKIVWWVTLKEKNYLPSGAVLTSEHSYRHNLCVGVKLSTEISLLLKQIEGFGSWWPSNSGSK